MKRNKSQIGEIKTFIPTSAKYRKQFDLQEITSKWFLKRFTLKVNPLQCAMDEELRIKFYQTSTKQAANMQER